MSESDNRSWRYRRQESRRFKFRKDQERKPRHPPHLRGRDIGLFYAERSRKAKKEVQRQQELEETHLLDSHWIDAFSLPEGQLEEIQELLNSTLVQLSSGHNNAYDHIEDSPFKENFLRTIRGNIHDTSRRNNLLISDERLDLQLFEQFNSKINIDVAYQMMLEKRQKLPTYAMKEELLKMIDENQIVVISGETGCGKTTQIPQFILDDYIMKKKGSTCHIICTQPRRISAISVSERVAQERAESLGHSVGYQIRLEKKLPRERGSIIFCTTGVALKRMQTDPYLNSFSHIVLDEIHERNIDSDFLIALIKQIMSKRKDLKIILMSATLNSEKFSQYYYTCPRINIPGFTYPVEEFYLEDVLERTKFKFETKRNMKFRDREEHRFLMDAYVRHLQSEKKYSTHVCHELGKSNCEELNLDLILSLLIYICEKEERDGAILVFLPGFADISSLNQLIEKCREFPASRYFIIPLHSQLPTVTQRCVFERPPRGVRKIILSTSIAETSITIDDVVYVIDSGRMKITNFQVDQNTETLFPEWETLANASQRKGRAGRVQEGVCYYLFSKRRQMTLDKDLKPEILRTRLENTILQVKVLQLGKAETFLGSLMDPPDAETIKLAISLLVRLNALDADENLTPLGYHLAKLPINPQMGKMILLGAIFNCLDPILSIACTLDFKDPFLLPMGKEDNVFKKKMELSQGWNSDHLVFHEALIRFEEGGTRHFCHEYFLSWHTLNLLQKMKIHFMDHLCEMNFVDNRDTKSAKWNYNSENLSLVKAIICAGLYPNIVMIRKGKKNRHTFFTLDEQRVELHPKSVLNKVEVFETPLLMYYTKLRTAKVYLHDATVVHPLPVIFFGDKYKERTLNIAETYKSIGIADRLQLKCNADTVSVIRNLRDRLNWFLEYKVSHPGPVVWDERSDDETQILRAIIKLITTEDSEATDYEKWLQFV